LHLTLVAAVVQRVVRPEDAAEELLGAALLAVVEVVVVEVDVVEVDEVCVPPRFLCECLRPFISMQGSLRMLPMFFLMRLPLKCITV
jgi:predicted CoA-binding protein